MTTVCAVVDVPPGSICPHQYPLCDIFKYQWRRRETETNRSVENCPGCFLLFESLARLFYKDVRETWVPLSIESSGWNGQTLQVRVVAGKGTPMELEFYCTMKHGSLPYPFVSVGFAHNVYDDPLSPDCLTLAKGWLRDCLKNHSHCETASSSRLPKRIICVGSKDREPFLSDWPRSKKAKYIALSYCWGNSLPLTTTLGSLEERKRRIALGSMPRTLKDAVVVAREFGIPYLWIDALCIIQDSAEDWAIESSKMAGIFENAHFVISAEAGAQCDAGFIRKRNIHSVQSPVEFHHSTALIKKSTIYARRRRRTYPGGVAHATIRDSKPRLATRGWVFQERYLALRTLIFAEEEIAWECRSIRRCECSEAVVPSSIPDMWGNWKRIIEVFTERRLNKPSDRLPAVSGMAAKYDECTGYGDRYVGGLWWKSFADHMLWYVSNPIWGSDVSRRQENYQAPSWSWASVTGAVTFYHMGFESDAGQALNFQVIDAQAKPASANQYGPVKWGWTTVTGLTCPLIVQGPAGINTPPILYLARENDESICVSRYFLPDATASRSEVSRHGKYMFLRMVRTKWVFAGLVLRKTFLEESWERVGFCCGSLYSPGEDLDGSTREEEPEAIKLGKFLDTKLSRRTVRLL